MTRERMRWYVDTQWTVLRDTGRIVPQPPTIHDDDDYARKQGLPAIIADGMISTNWIMSLLIDVFGPQILSKGKLTTKYIAPVYENQVLISVARIAEARAAAERRQGARPRRLVRGRQREEGHGRQRHRPSAGGLTPCPAPSTASVSSTSRACSRDLRQRRSSAISAPTSSRSKSPDGATRPAPSA